MGSLAGFAGSEVHSRTLADELLNQPSARSEAELRRLGGIKWTRHGDEVLPAWVADMDLAPPPLVVDTVRRLADNGDFGYNLAAADQLGELFSQWQNQHYRWAPAPSENKVFCDVLHAIDMVLWLYTKPGDGIVLLTPVYPPFIGAVHGAGRRIVSVPLTRPDWSLDADRLAAAVDANTKAVLLCHPHNPTGRMFSGPEREAIAEVVMANDLLLISDEVWGDLTYADAGSEGHVPMALVDGLEQHTVTVSSASKSFNLAGLRCAVAHIGHTAVRQMMAELPSHFLGAVSTPGAEATAACWTQGHDWLAATRSYLTERRDQTVALVNKRLDGVTMSSPEATYLAWLDVSAKMEQLGPTPGAWYLDHARVALGEGTDFGPEGEGFVRLNFATSPTMLEAIVGRMAEAVSA